MTDPANTHTLPSTDALSPSGCERLEAALPLLRREVVARGRRDATARIAAGFAVVVGVVMVARYEGHTPARTPVTFVTANTPPGTPAIVVGDPPADRPSPRVAIVTTDPRVTQRLMARPNVGVIRLNDDELRAALREAGRPDGLVRVGHEVLTLSEPPTPPEGTPLPASDPGHGA